MYIPFDTEIVILGYYFTGYSSKIISAPFMTPLLQYHTDDSLKVTQGDLD